MKDPNINIIKNKIKELQPESSIILFGSRALGTQKEDSYYDILMQLKKVMKNTDKRRIASNIRRALWKLMIDVDLIVRDIQNVKDYEALSGSVTSEAIKKGLILL